MQQSDVLDTALEVIDLEQNSELSKSPAEVKKIPEKQESEEAKKEVSEEKLLAKEIKDVDDPDLDLQKISAFPQDNETEPKDQAEKIIEFILKKEQIKKTEKISACERYARDIWAGIEHMAQTPTGFPIDRLILEPGKKEKQNQKTSPTNIGLFLSSIIAARDLEQLSSKESNKYIDKVLTSLEKAPTFQGLFYNWYNTQTGNILEGKDSSFISTVDNAWLIAGLRVIEAAAPQFSDRVRELISGMNFPLLYDRNRDLFYGGFNPDSRQPTQWHYGILNTEGRMASYVGISEFDISSKNYAQLRESKFTEEQQFSSWGGSMFEALMPTLFVPEQLWSEEWKKNLTDYIQQQIIYGSKNTGGFWGYSSCDDPSGIYTEYGLSKLAAKEGGYGVSQVITPYALFLSIGLLPEQSVTTLQRLEAKYDIYKEGFGFADSVDVKTGEVAPSYLSLDQQISFLSISNFLKRNNIQNYFSLDLEKTLKPLIKSIDYVASIAA